MLVSIRHRLVILAMPKCASSALEEALASKVDMVLRGHPRLKHTTFRKYDRFLRPYLEGYTDAPLEVVSLFRHPEDWLHSWWRYRRRHDLAHQENTTRHMSFDSFVAAYLDGERKPADVGRQSRFVSDKTGRIAVNRLFRYDQIEVMIGFLQERLETQICLERLNTSPPAPWLGGRLSTSTRTALKTALATDYEIHASIAA